MISLFIITNCDTYFCEEGTEKHKKKLSIILMGFEEMQSEIKRKKKCSI